ncbi:MAG: hypothetical protein DRI86_02315 [Bacteroidetes bacterium]|nr:MAG: hypothetical protein DRI86_02315 [Bacteroidota bacterium]
MVVDVITPDKTLFSGNAGLVRIPGIDGSFEVLDHHAPLVSIIVKGTVTIIDDKKQNHDIEVNGGVIEVNNNTVKILAE